MSYEIVSVTQDPAGVWSALLTVNGDPILATRKYGSWMLPVGETYHEVLPHVAADLQDNVRRLEREAGAETFSRRVARA